MTWPLKWKLIEPKEYTDARFSQQGVRPIEGLAQVRLYCCRHYLNNIHIFMNNREKKLAICLLQNAKSNFPKFCKIYASQNQKTNLIYLYIHLVETFALVLHSKNVFKRLFLAKVINTKKIHCILLTL